MCMCNSLALDSWFGTIPVPHLQAYYMRQYGTIPHNTMDTRKSYMEQYDTPNTTPSIIYVYTRTNYMERNVTPDTTPNIICVYTRTNYKEKYSTPDTRPYNVTRSSTWGNKIHLTL